MAGYIVLCDHNIGWQEIFQEKLAQTGIDTVSIENISEIDSHFDNSRFTNIIVCSLIELKEYIEKYEIHKKIVKGIFEKADVFVITDEKNDDDEIRAFRAGCVDFQSRERNMDVILQRLISHAEKKVMREKTIINIKEMVVEYKDISVGIKDNEAKLLELLLNSDDEFVSIEKICRNLWNRSDNITRVNLSSLIYRLRKKMPDGGKCIKSIYGKGYYLSKNEIQMCV